MKLPFAFAVPVLVSVATVLQSSNPAEARPRHHHQGRASTQILTPPPSFDSPRVVAPETVSSGQVYSRRSVRSQRRHRGLARYATNEVQPGAVMSDAGRPAPIGSFTGLGGGSDLITEARRYLGGNPTGKASLWCGNFMNLVLQRTGHKASNSNLARSFASYGRRVSGPQVGAIAVMSRKGGGHVGIVTGVDANGKIMVISGNHNRRVAEAPYPASRIFAYVMPN
jgi:uncharacterized protein (TIGR02594 family)